MDLYRNKRDLEMAEEPCGEDELEATGEEKKEEGVGINDNAEQNIQERYNERSSSSNWLQLYIGGGATSSSAALPPTPANGGARRHPAELELFPDRQNLSSVSAIKNTRSSAAVSSQTLQEPVAERWPHRGGKMQLGFCGGTSRIMAHPQPKIAAAAAAAVMFNYGPIMYPVRRHPAAAAMKIEGECGSTSCGGAATDLRVKNPPPRPHTGVWFMLRASENLTRDLLLPQIPKCYLRIKDGRMTIRLLMKYLMNKFGLENESEVEVTCRGQQLVPNLTLQHVRDNIWRRRDASATFIPDSPACDLIMTLYYSRSSSS